MIDVIANNIANVNTTGFKRSRASFEDLLYETIQGARVETPQEQETLGPIQIGMGTRLSAVVRLDTQGTPQQTGRTLDVAIQGDGYFQVQRPNGGVGYTRDGSFTLSDTGAVVTSDGYPLVPSLVIPSDSQNLAISSSGVVTITNTGGKTTQIGQIELTRFLNPTGLEDLGQNQYGQTAASGEPIQGAPMSTNFGSILQGNLESSNVDIVQEMTDMITAQRAYEINAKAVQTSETMLDDTMRSFGSVLAGLLTLAGAALAQAPAAPSGAIPPRLVQRVVADIAQQWAGDTVGLQLVWGHVPHAAMFPPKTGVRIVGRGDGGWFVAVFDPGSTGPFAVRVRAGAPDSTLVAARTVETGRS